MNLRVIHLIRKVERIDRDLEELDALLGTLQMDREYSMRLRDSLIEESFRLKQLRQKISSQIIRIPAHFEQFVEDTVPASRPRADVRPASSEVQTPSTPPAGTKTTARPEPPRSIPEPTPRPLEVKPEVAAIAARTPSEPGETPKEAPGQTMTPVERPGRKGDKKKPPFLFRFE